MVSSNQLVSNLFNGVSTFGDLQYNLEKLCLDNLHYKYVKEQECSDQIFRTDYSMTYEDFSAYQRSLLYSNNWMSYLHFTRPLPLGFVKLEGLVSIANLEGWVDKSDAQKSTRRLKVRSKRILGYGGPYLISKSRVGLDPYFYEKLKIPKFPELRKLTEEELKKAVEIVS